MRNVRCPVFVGREADVDVLGDAIEEAAQGRGGVVLLLGEAGVGKSRLVEVGASAAASRGMTVLRGRGSPSPAPAPYRPIAEALLSALRTTGPPDLPDLPWVRPALGLIVPAWGGPPAERLAETSVVLLGEAVLAVLHALGHPHGAFVVLEDLHWADPATLELLEYLVDKLGGSSVTLVVTIRVGEGSGAEKLARSLQARRQASVVELGRLPPGDVAQMVTASLGGEHVPPELIDVIREGSEGLPFLVEELLASLIAAEALVREQGRWRARTPLRPAVPASFAAGVRERLVRMSPSASRILQTAAILGDHLELDLLRATTGTGNDEMVTALRQAAELQLVEEDRARNAYRFRHALTRAAVEETLLLPERRSLATHALATLEAGDLSDPRRLELAAQLADAAGDDTRACNLLIASASAALRQGALSSATALAEKVVARETSSEVALRAEEILLDAAVLAGNHPRANQVGEKLLARLEIATARPARRAHVHLRLAQSAVTATEWTRAEHHLSRAAVLMPSEEQELESRRQLLQARVRLGQHRVDEAAAYVRGALDTAQRLGLDEVLYESLELMGRVHRPRDLDEAEHWFTRALVAAEESESKVAYVRALFELGVIDMMRLRPPDRLRRAHDRAVELGLPVLGAQAGLHLAVALFSFFELDEAAAAGQEAYDIAVRYQLGLLAPAALSVLGALEAARGRRAEALAFFERARPFMDAEAEANARGQILAQAAIAVEDRPAALEELGRAEVVAPTGSAVTRSTFRGILAVVLALEADGPVPLVDELRREAGSLHVVAAALADFAEAVLVGRSGDRRSAEALFLAADQVLAPAPWFRMVGRRLVAEAAIPDQWGSPRIWLAEALAFFEDAELEDLARACRSLLGRAGSPLKARNTGAEFGPGGITRREADVFALVAEGLSNKEIAERLYLSARTVEKHVERLLLKTGASNRAQLAALAGRLGPLRR